MATQMFEIGRCRDKGVLGHGPHDGRIQKAETILCDAGGEFSAKAHKKAVFMRDNDSACLLKLW